MISLPEIVRYVDGYLRIREIEDWPNALNGLQIENSGCDWNVQKKKNN